MLKVDYGLSLNTLVFVKLAVSVLAVKRDLLYIIL
jgi:hypothetical protein